MKGKVLFMVVSVILAVTIGYSSDISGDSTDASVRCAAYVTDGQSHTRVVSSALSGDTRLTQTISHSNLEQASTTLAAISENVKEEPTAEVMTETSPTAEGAAVGVASKTTSESTDSDVLILQKIVMAEAGGEDLEGQIMVANVVMNRVKAGFGDSIAEVVFAPGQFEPVQTGSYDAAVPTDSVIEAVNRALTGEDYSMGALYFCSVYCDHASFDKNLTFIVQHGNHLFYR